jgi:hypothetical protein
MRLDWQDGLVFVALFLLSIALPFKYGLVLLGAALILFGPFIILERFAFPGLRKFNKLAVLIGILSVFAGGLCWLHAFGLP